MSVTHHLPDPGHRPGMSASAAAIPGRPDLPIAYIHVLELANLIPEIPATRPRSLARYIERKGGPLLPAIDFALESLQQTLKVSKPQHSQLLIDACRRIAGWAEFCSGPGTALGYVQAAIEINKGDSAEYAAGRRAAQQGRRLQAYVLFDLAARYATEAQDWVQVGKAWTQLGRLRLMDEEFELAKTAHANALKIARLHGLKKQEAQALHNLATVATDQRDGVTAFLYAELALQAYGSDYESIALLANDVAYFWMDTEGAYARALELFEASLPYASQPIDELDILANIARAHAGLNSVGKYEAYRNRVRALAPDIPYKERVGGAIMELAFAAYSLNRFDEAEKYAKEARLISGPRGEKKYTKQSLKLLRGIKARRAYTPPKSSRVATLRNDDLAARLVLLLRKGRTLA